MTTRNHYPRASRFVTQQVWAIRESTMDTIVEVMRMRAGGIEMSEEEIQARIGAARPGATVVRGSVAVIPLQGVIGPKMNMFLSISGGTSLDMFMKEFRQHRDDASISAIICDCDSPGGSVLGLKEAFDEIYASRGSKPTFALVNHMCASAALYIASAFGQIVCTPSGEIGAIGTIMVHEDLSKANEMAGVKPTYITYGQFKSEGNPDMPLSDETYKYLTEQCAVWGIDFESAVAKGRGVSLTTVRKEYGQGRMLMAKDALSVKLIDAIMTPEQLVAKLASGASIGGARATVVDEVHDHTDRLMFDSMVAAEGQAMPVDATLAAEVAATNAAAAAAQAQADADAVAVTLALTETP